MNDKRKFLICNLKANFVILSRFSINFVNDLCKDPADITYHFKWLLDENVIVENFKEDGLWIDHIETKYDVLDGALVRAPSDPNDTENVKDSSTFIAYSIPGSVFELEFAFQHGIIDVYKIYDGGHNRVTSYEPQFQLSDIKGLQVWGDVKKVKEVTFYYA